MMLMWDTQRLHTQMHGFLRVSCQDGRDSPLYPHCSSAEGAPTMCQLLGWSPTAQQPSRLSRKGWGERGKPDDNHTRCVLCHSYQIIPVSKAASGLCGSASALIMEGNFSQGGICLIIIIYSQIGQLSSQL